MWVAILLDVTMTAKESDLVVPFRMRRAVFTLRHLFVFQIIHLKGYTEEELLGYKSIIFNNVYSSMKTILKAASDFEINIKTKKNRVRFSQSAYAILLFWVLW